MDLLQIDLNVMGEGVKKYTTSTVLEDFKIVQAMKLHSEWMTQATSLSKKIVEIKSAILQWGLTELEDEAKSICSKISFNDQQLSAVIDHAKRSDDKRGLFSDRPAKAWPTKLTTFSGQDHEDLITFKDRFNLSADNNKISRTDQ